MSGKWAPDNSEGLHAYVVATSSWGRTTERIEYAASLKDAKAKYGWTRMRYTSVTVRRALADEAHLPGHESQGTGRTEA